MRAKLVEAFGALEQAGARPTCTDLRPPAAGELLLAWFVGEAPGGERAVVGFAATAGGVRAVRANPTAVDGAALLASFDAELEAAERVRLIAELEDDAHIAPHAAPWRGQPLALARPVGWALDVPQQAVERTGRRALVVADPRGDLPAARREGDAAAAALSAGQWTVEALRGDAARGAAVRRALGEVELVHYAGHGRAAQADPWAAHLALAGESRLSVRDLLALGRGPRWAVLTGCRTGLVDPRAAAGGMGIAQAFLLAGAEGVLAATADVDDALAGELGVAVAAGLAEAGSDLPTAVHRARAALGARPGWAAFRVWVP